MNATDRAVFMAGTLHLCNEISQPITRQMLVDLRDALDCALREDTFTHKSMSVEELLDKFPCNRGPVRYVTPLEAMSQKALAYRGPQ